MNWGKLTSHLARWSGLYYLLCWQPPKTKWSGNTRGAKGKKKTRKNQMNRQRGRWKDRATVRGCRQEQKRFKISFQQGWPPTDPTAFQSIPFQNCPLWNSCIRCRWITQPQQSLSPPAFSASLPPRCLIPTQLTEVPLGSCYKSFSQACANLVLLDWKYIWETATFSAL